MDSQSQTPEEEYSAMLTKFHKNADKHVLELETDLFYPDAEKIYRYTEAERKAGNELVAIMKRNMEQLKRTKRYRKLISLYRKYATAKDKVSAKQIASELESMQMQYHVTWDDCRKTIIPIGEKYGLKSVTALTKAENVWRGVSKCLYSNGKTIHFQKRDITATIRAKQIDRCIVFSVDNGKLHFDFNGLSFGVLIKDRFESDEVSAIAEYLTSKDAIDKKAVDEFEKSKMCISTYRPCFATIVCKYIRGRHRIYVQITIEGKAKPKFNSHSEPRHQYGTGVVGCDIGTQTIAYTSDTEVGLENLAERGSSIKKNERIERLIYRAMDRSRRATNPQNYNSDGTVKKGHKTWKYSNRYKRLRRKHQNLCRINATNRHLAINEKINYLRSLGDTFVTEPQNAKALQKRAKETTVNKNGKINRKKRFGKSIKNRCCGYFQAKAKDKFESTGGCYKEVSKNYKASQYDHTSDSYVPKKLSVRMYKLSDGTPVQRDWYSSFLLYNINFKTGKISKSKCLNSFEKQYKKEVALIEIIKAKKLKIMNSGIKTA